jgi:hypothetical protein
MTPHPLHPNPFTTLGLPEWPDLDDETVHAAWLAIAAETHPDRPDGGNLARYTQAEAAYNEISCPWGRSEAYADLVEAAWAQGRYDAYPDRYPPGCDPGCDPGPDREDLDGDIPLYRAAWETELGPVPLSEILHALAEVPARFRRGHPRRLAVRAAATAGLCAAVLILVTGRAAGFAAAALIWLFIVSARQDIAPQSRPVRRLPPPGNR